MENISVSKKIRMARNSLYMGTGMRVFKVFFLLFSVIMGAAIINFSLFDDEPQTAFIFVFNFLFMSQYLFFTNAVIPNFVSQKQRMMMKGCCSACDTLMLFPIRKKDCMKMSFRAWALASSISLSVVAALNVAVLFTDRYNDRKGTIAFSAVIVLFVVSATLIMTMFASVFGKKYMKFLGIAALIIYLCFFVFSLFLSGLESMSWVYEAFSGFAGLPAIIVIVLTIPVMYALSSLLVINKKGSEAWYNE